MAIRPVNVSAPPAQPIYTGVDPAALARRRELAQQLLAESQAPTEISSIPQGLAKLGEVFLRQKTANRAEAAESAAAEDKRRMLAATIEQGLMSAQGAGGMDSLARILSSNPDTAQAGLETFIKTQPQAVKPTPLMQNYEAAVQQGYKGSLLDYQKELRAAGKSETNITNTVGGSLTKGQEEVDKKFAAEFTDFVLGGGFADVDKGLSQLDEVVNNLESGANLTGPVIGNMPDSVRAITNPESLNTQQLVEEVVQRNLRLVLGAQFTEKEGERLIARAYNPRLDEATNAKRVRRLMGSIKKARDAKFAAAQYFQQKGTMVGYNGTQFVTPEDIARDAGLPESDTSDAPEYTQEDLEYTARKHGVDVDEVKRRLGIE